MEGRDPPVLTVESEEDTFWEGERQESRMEQTSDFLNSNPTQVCPDSLITGSTSFDNFMPQT